MSEWIDTMQKRFWTLQKTWCSSFFHFNIVNHHLESPGPHKCTPEIKQVDGTRKRRKKNKCVLARLDQQFSGVMDIYIKGKIWTLAAPLWVCTLCLQFLNHRRKHSFWSLKGEICGVVRSINQNGLLPRDCTFKLMGKRFWSYEVLLNFLLCPSPFESSCKEMGVTITLIHKLTSLI
jgi:hypothetical protein